MVKALLRLHLGNEEGELGGKQSFPGASWQPNPNDLTESSSSLPQPSQPGGRETSERHAGCCGSLGGGFKDTRRRADPGRSKQQHEQEQAGKRRRVRSLGTGERPALSVSGGTR